MNSFISLLIGFGIFVFCCVLLHYVFKRMYSDKKSTSNDVQYKYRIVKRELEDGRIRYIVQRSYSPLIDEWEDLKSFNFWELAEVHYHKLRGDVIKSEVVIK